MFTDTSVAVLGLIIVALTAMGMLYKIARLATIGSPQPAKGHYPGTVEVGPFRFGVATKAQSGRMAQRATIDGLIKIWSHIDNGNVYFLWQKESSGAPLATVLAS